MCVLFNEVSSQGKGEGVGEEEEEQERKKKKSTVLWSYMSWLKKKKRK